MSVPEISWFVHNRRVTATFEYEGNAYTLYHDKSPSDSTDAVKAWLLSKANRKIESLKNAVPS